MLCISFVHVRYTCRSIILFIISLFLSPLLFFLPTSLSRSLCFLQCSDKPSDLISLTLSIDQYTTEVQPREGVTLSTFKNILKLFTTINKEINAKIKQ